MSREELKHTEVEQMASEADAKAEVNAKAAVEASTEPAEGAVVDSGASAKDSDDVKQSGEAVQAGDDKSDDDKSCDDKSDDVTKSADEKQAEDGKYRPTLEQLKDELDRENHRTKFRSVLRSTIFTLVTVAAAAVLVAVLFLPVLQVFGSSMNPTLAEGNIVLSVKNAKFETGDVIAFYYNNKILIKRAIANPGDWVDIDENGNVSVNGKPIDEPYLTDKAFGDCDIKLPYQVPESRVFVMGDNRSVSVDSRSQSVGCVADEQIVGKIVFRVWPISDFGPIAQ